MRSETGSVAVEAAFVIAIILVVMVAVWSCTAASLATVPDTCLFVAS